MICSFAISVIMVIQMQIKSDLIHRKHLALIQHEDTVDLGLACHSCPTLDY